MTFVAIPYGSNLLEAIEDDVGWVRGFRLATEISNWLSDNKIRTTFVKPDGTMYLHFSDPKDAMLFKLTWVGS